MSRRKTFPRKHSDISTQSRPPVRKKSSASRMISVRTYSFSWSIHFLLIVSSSRDLLTGKKGGFPVIDIFHIINRLSPVIDYKKFSNYFRFECQFYFRWYQLLLELTIHFIYRYLNSRRLPMTLLRYPVHDSNKIEFNTSKSKHRGFLIEDGYWVSGDVRYAKVLNTSQSKGSSRFHNNLYIRLTLWVSIFHRVHHHQVNRTNCEWSRFVSDYHEQIFYDWRTITVRGLDYIHKWYRWRENIYSLYHYHLL